MTEAGKSRKQNGGARPGAGRPPNDSEEYHIRLGRNTRVLLDRFAKTVGLQRRAKSQFWDEIISRLLQDVNCPEPEYQQLIRKDRTPILGG